MLKMLKLRTNIKKNIKNLMNSINSLEGFPQEISDHQKLFILTEQLIFVKYLLTIAPNNSMYTTFKDTCITAINKLPHNTTNQETNQDYTKFRFILRQVSTNFDNDSEWIHLSTIMNNKYGTECAQLPTEFYQPFLHSLSNTFPESKITLTPVLLYPYLYKDINGIYASYTTEVFTSFDYTHKCKHDDNQNPIFKYLSQFNWNGKQFGHVIQVLSNLHMDLGSNEQKDITAVINKGLTCGHIDKIKNMKCKITQLMNFVHKLSTTYGMPLTDTQRVGDLLSRFDGFDSEAIEYLMVQEPSMYMKNKFDKVPELKFLSYIVEDRCNKTIYGKEDAGKEEDNTPDDSEVAVDDDDFSVEDTTDEIDTTTDVSQVDESEDMTDTSSSIESPEANVANDETDTVSEDPTAIPYNVMVADPSTETIMYRHRVANALRKLIKNPPSDMTTSTTTALKMWLTQWLYIVSPSTTRRFLTLLLNNQSMISKV